MVGKIQITSSKGKGSIEKFLKMAGRNHTYRPKVEAVAKKGVEALRAATPRDSGLTAESWSYEIVEDSGGMTIYWINENQNQGRNIAALIRYGHGTRNGGYVPANDFVTPALRPIYKEIADEAWKEVTST